MVEKRFMKDVMQRTAESEPGRVSLEAVLKDASVAIASGVEYFALRLEEALSGVEESDIGIVIYLLKCYEARLKDAGGIQAAKLEKLCSEIVSMQIVSMHSRGK